MVVPALVKIHLKHKYSFLKMKLLLFFPHIIELNYKLSLSLIL